MKSIALVIPFFGKKPSYFDLWKYTALKNPSVDFLFFTDIGEITAEKNIKVYRTSFHEFADLFKSKFDFPICLNAPYKLCDFKPTYGYVLREYLVTYDFWGHADIDVLLGDIRAFIKEDILQTFDRILELGHFCLYRNVKDINLLFQSNAGYKDYDYKKCLSSPDAMYFDEALGMMAICNKNNISTYKNNGCFFDVLPGYKQFTHINDSFGKSIFRYDDKKGKLYAVYKDAQEIKEKEIMYAHFQKRKMDFIQFRANDDFYVIPNKLIVSHKDIDVNKLFKVKGKRFYKLKRKFIHLKDFLSRYKKSGIKSLSKFRKERKIFRHDLANAKKEAEVNCND